MAFKNAKQWVFSKPGKHAAIFGKVFMDWQLPPTRIYLPYKLVGGGGGGDFNVPATKAIIVTWATIDTCWLELR